MLRQSTEPSIKRAETERRGYEGCTGIVRRSLQMRNSEGRAEEGVRRYLVDRWKVRQSRTVSGENEKVKVQADKEMKLE